MFLVAREDSGIFLGNKALEITQTWALKYYSCKRKKCPKGSTFLNPLSSYRHLISNFLSDEKQKWEKHNNTRFFFNRLSHVHDQHIEPVLKDFENVNIWEIFLWIRRSHRTTEKRGICLRTWKRFRSVGKYKSRQQWQSLGTKTVKVCLWCVSTMDLECFMV